MNPDGKKSPPKEAAASQMRNLLDLVWFCIQEEPRHPCRSEIYELLLEAESSHLKKHSRRMRDLLKKIMRTRPVTLHMFSTHDKIKEFLRKAQL